MCMYVYIIYIVVFFGTVRDVVSLSLLVSHTGKWTMPLTLTSLLLQVLCTLIAAFLHFFFLSSFCWVLTEAWQSYMAVTGRLRNRIIRKRFLCLGWGGPPVCCSHWFPWPLASAPFTCVVFPCRSPCTGRGDLSGVHQGKGIRNTELVSMLCSGCSICLFNYGCSDITHGGVYVCSIINLSLSIPYIFYHPYSGLSPPSVPPLCVLPLHPPPGAF